MDIDSALELMNKYEYSSITSHPYIYQFGDTIGICYTYVDDEYGALERIKVCKSLDEMESFLSSLKWVETNGKSKHVRMVLDNYESYNPKVIFLRNEKIMVAGEMADIDGYDNKEAMRNNMDEVSKYVYEAGDLLLVYNEIKNRQLLYLSSIVNLKNTLRTKYYDLQVAVDIYNRIKVKRELKLLSDVSDLGINDSIEISLKDKYNIFVVQMPELNEAKDFLKEVWEMLFNLELNQKYYDAIKEDTEIRNEIKVVEQKIALMKDLNDDLKSLFGVDLVAKFQKINKQCKESSASVSDETISGQIESVKRKYSHYTELDPLLLSDYLKEAMQNTNYDELAVKYSSKSNLEALSKMKMPLNDVVADLLIKYREKLSLEEQSIMVLYNNEKYRKIFDILLSISDIDKLPIKQVLKTINSVKGISKLKSECYDSVKRRIDLPENEIVKKSLFNNVDFTSFETFITSLINKLSMLKDINEKMVLPGKISLYLTTKDLNDLQNKSFVLLTNDLNVLREKVKTTKEIIGITLLNEGVPVIYSPYYFDLGDTFTKDASPLMYIKEMTNFDLLVDVSDINIKISPDKKNVIDYQSISNVSGNLTIVEDLVMKNMTVFGKLIFDRVQNDNGSIQVSVASVDENNTTNVVQVSSELQRDVESQDVQSTIEEPNNQ